MIVIIKHSFIESKAGSNTIRLERSDETLM